MKNARNSEILRANNRKRHAERMVFNQIPIIFYDLKIRSQRVKTLFCFKTPKSKEKTKLYNAESQEKQLKKIIHAILEALSTLVMFF